MSVIQSVYQIQLRRTNDAIQLWESSDKTTAHFAAGGTTSIYPAVPPGVRSDNFFVEWTSTGPAVTTSDLEVWFVGNGEEYRADYITFRPYKSLVIGFVGESQHPGERTTGMNQLITTLRNEAYDALIFDEDDITYDSAFSYVRDFAHDVILDYEAGQGETQQKSVAEVVNAVRNRGVTELAIIGYSHGGGATRELAAALQTEFGVGYDDFDLKYVAYIDAVAKQSAGPETNRPVEAKYHVNFWQSGPSVAGYLQLVQGTNVEDADVNDNVDSAADGLFYYQVGRLHTNRNTLQGRRGIMEALPIQSAIVEGTEYYDGVKDRLNGF